MQLYDPVTCKVEVNNQPFINGIFKSIKCAKGGGGACFILPWLRSHFESCCSFLFSSLHRQEFRCSPPLSGWPQPALRTDANYLELILIRLMSWWNLNDFPKFVALPCLWSLGQSSYRLCLPKPVEWLSGQTVHRKRCASGGTKTS